MRTTPAIRETTPRRRFWPTPSAFLLLLMAASMLSLAVSVFATHGENLTLVYYQEQGIESPMENIGMDMYNSMLYAQNETYLTTSAIYPPLNYVFYALLAHSVPQIANQTGELMDQPGSLLTSQAAIMTFVILSVLGVLMLTWAVRRLGGMSGWKGALLTVSVLFAGPVLYVLERGNSVLFVIGFVGVFLLWYRSERRALRELALICLAIAAALKIYPAVFGCLLLREKRWADSVRAVLYGIVLFFVPFAFMGGWAGIHAYFTTCLSDAMDLLGGYGYTGGGSRVDLLNIMQVAIRLLHVIGGTTISRAAIAMLIFVPFLSRSHWRAVLAATALCVLAPSFNQYYAACFYLLPIGVFLGESEGRATDYFYALALALTVCVLPYGTEEFIPAALTKARAINLTVVACNMGQICLLALLLLEGAIDAAARLRHGKAGKCDTQNVSNG